MAKQANLYKFCWEWYWRPSSSAIPIEGIGVMPGSHVVHPNLRWTQVMECGIRCGPCRSPKSGVVAVGQSCSIMHLPQPSVLQVRIICAPGPKSCSHTNQNFPALGSSWQGSELSARTSRENRPCDLRLNTCFDRYCMSPTMFDHASFVDMEISSRCRLPSVFPCQDSEQRARIPSFTA